MFRLGEIRKASKVEEGIDIGPLIDIVFILLIFFMVSTSFVRHLEIPLERPSARSAQRSAQQAIRLTITRQGNLFLEGQPLQAWMVQDRVRQLLQAQPRRPVMITADRRAEAGILVEVVDQCRLAGAKHTAVETESER